MDNSFQRPGANSDTQSPRGFIAASLHIFENILNGLAGFVQLTEEEWDAGIYLGDPPANDYQHSQYSDNEGAT